MNRRHSLTLFSGLLATSGRTLACLWDRDTLKDELVSNPDALDLILGQFPHHSDIYYQTRRNRLEKKSNLEVNEINDLAVAYVRLKEFKKGMDLLEAQLKKTPSHYETLSNIGVTAKKSGDFQKGAEFIAKALAIKPGGHMGLGDWYLKALNWRAKHENAGPENAPAANFLGMPYAGAFPPKYYGSGHGKMPDGYPVAKDDYSRFPQMIRNDQSFADGFAAYGDFLSQRGDLNLAFLAHTRAVMLKHQNLKEVERRRAAYLKHAKAHLQEGAVSRRRGPAKSSPEIAQAEERIKGGLAWLSHYKAVEGELVRKEGDERKVSIKQVEEELKRRKIHRVTIAEPAERRAPRSVIKKKSQPDLKSDRK